jgi:hypothetical protein
MSNFHVLASLRCHAAAGSGLSSSSALVVAAALALLALWGIASTPAEAAELTCSCERYVGTQVSSDWLDGTRRPSKAHLQSTLAKHTATCCWAQGELQGSADRQPRSRCHCWHLNSLLSSQVPHTLVATSCGNTTCGHPWSQPIIVYTAETITFTARTVLFICCAAQGGGMDQAVSLMAQPGVAMHVEFNPVSLATASLQLGQRSLW